MAYTLGTLSYSNMYSTKRQLSEALEDSFFAGAEFHLFGFIPVPAEPLIDVDWTKIIVGTLTISLHRAKDSVEGVVWTCRLVDWLLMRLGWTIESR